jgi:hypothetical protein
VKRRLGGLVASVALAAGMLVPMTAEPAAPAVTVRGDVMGFGVTLPSQAQINLIAAQGVKWIRLGHQWDWVTGNVTPANTNPASWTGWADLENRINWAHAAGLKVLVMAQATPWWANGQSYTANASHNGFYYPDAAHLPDWANYVNGIAARGADAIEVWNEPNDVAFAKPTVSPPFPGVDAARQAALQRYTYDHVKPLHPSVLIISGGTAAGASDGSFGNYCTQNTAPGDPAQFLLDEYLATPPAYNGNRGFAGSFDGLGYHPYAAEPMGAAPPAYCFNGAERTRALFDLTAFFGDRKPVWLTEFGTLTDGPFGAGEVEAAARYDEYFAKFDDLRARGVPIAQYFPFTIQDGPNPNADPADGYGVYDVNGVEEPAAPKIRTEAARAADTTAPSISQRAIGHIRGETGTVSASATWSTNELSTTHVDYGLTASYGSTVEATKLDTAHSIAVAGLQPGKTYHYRIQSADALGNTATSGDATFIAGLEFQPVQPTQILDTRNNIAGCYRPNNTPVTCSRIPGNNQPLTVQVTGAGGVPSGASAAVLLVSTFTPAANSSMVVYPSDSPDPGTRDLTLNTGQVSSNTVYAELGPDGRVTIDPNTATDVTIVVQGYFESPPGAAGGGYTPINASRIADSRGTPPTGSCTPSPCSPLTAGSTKSIQVTGQGGVPASGLSAAVLAITVTGTSATGFAQAYPTGTTRPNARSISYAANDTVTSTVTTKLSAGGAFDLYSFGGNLSYFVDVVGYYASASGSGSDFVPTVSTRIADTRPSSSVPGVCQPGAVACPALVPGAETMTLQVSGQGGVPATGVTAVSVNVTAINTNTAAGYLKIGATGTTPTRMVSYAAGETTSSSLVVRAASNGQLVFTVAPENSANPSAAQVLVEVTGWFVPPT